MYPGPWCVAVCMQALSMSPDNTAYALNLMHALELEQAYDRALGVLRDFCATTTIRLGGGVELQVCALLACLPACLPACLLACLLVFVHAYAGAFCMSACVCCTCSWLSVSCT